MRLQSTTKQTPLLLIQTAEACRYWNPWCFHHQSTTLHSRFNSGFLLPVSWITLHVRSNRLLQHCLWSLCYGHLRHKGSANDFRSFNWHERRIKRCFHQFDDPRIHGCCSSGFDASGGRTDSLQSLADDGWLRNRSSKRLRICDAQSRPTRRCHHSNQTTRLPISNQRNAMAKSKRIEKKQNFAIGNLILIGISFLSSRRTDGHSESCWSSASQEIQSPRLHRCHWLRNSRTCKLFGLGSKTKCGARHK